MSYPKNRISNRISRLTLSLLAGLVVMGMQSAQAHETKTITGFKMPESVVEAKDGRLFISEIGEFGKDGDGQVSVVEKDGTVKPFATGMNDPKGLAFIGKDLYVADKTQVLKVSPDGKWTVYADASAFEATPQFLNDLVADPLGNLYVSDTGDMKGTGGNIYRITKDGKAHLVIDSKKDARILGPNGLLVDKTGHVLLEVDFISGILYSYDMKTGTLTQLAEGFGGGDGLVQGAKDTLYVSDWANGKVFSVKKGEVTLIKDGFKASADIALSKDGKYLLVPDMKAGELVYLPIH